MATKRVAKAPRTSRRRPYLKQAKTVRVGEFYKFNQLAGRKRYEVMRCDVCEQPLKYTEGSHGEYEFTFGSLPYHVHPDCYVAMEHPEARREILLTRAGLHSPFWRNAVEIMLTTIWFGEPVVSGEPAVAAQVAK